MTDIAQFMQDAEDEAWALYALVKGKRLPHHVEKRDKRGRRYWGPPDSMKAPVAVASSGSVHEALDAGQKLSAEAMANGGRDHSEAARASARDNQSNALRLLIQHTPLEKLREVAKEHGIMLAATLRQVVQHNEHKRLARKWRTPRTGTTPNQRDIGVRYDNIQHLGIKDENAGTQPTSRFPLVRALLDAAEMPDDIRDRVHGHIHAVHESLRDNRAVKVPRRKRAEAKPDDSWMGTASPPEGSDHDAAAHHHLTHAEKALRAAGKHDAADAVATARVEAQHGPVHEQIRNAYKSLAKNSGDFVSLTALRGKLHADLPRGHVDRALAHMFHTDGAHLRPNENVGSLTVEDRASAIRMGDKDRHLIRVN